jgi:uncharacterized protein YbjT (DUF2867 family)
MILVTGASGNIGSKLINELVRLKQPVRAGYHSVTKAPRLSGVEAVALDYEARDSVADAVRGVEKVFVISSNSQQQPTLEASIVEQAKKAGVKHVVKLSVWAADKEQYIFARQHRACEKAIESARVPWTFLRPNSFMQNTIAFFGESVKRQGAFYLPVGDAAVSQIDARDIAEVAAKVLTTAGHEGRTYALSGPESLTYAQVAETFTAALGKPVNYVPIPPEAFGQSLRQFGMPPWHIEATLDYEADVAAGHAAQVTDDVARILGRAPRSFAQFVRDHIAAFR